MTDTVATTPGTVKELEVKPIVKLEGEVAKFAHDALAEISKEWAEAQNNAQRIANEGQRLIRAAEIRLGIKQKEIVKQIAEKHPDIVVGDTTTHGFDLRYMNTHGEVYVHQAQAPASATTVTAPTTAAVAPATTTASAEAPATVTGATA